MPRVLQKNLANLYEDIGQNLAGLSGIEVDFLCELVNSAVL